LRTNSRFLFLLIALMGAFATPAAAVHWPQQGGDAGRSGYQPVGDGAAPVRALWSAEGDVVGAPLITSGALSEQRVIYGTTDGRVHLRDLSTGREQGAAGGSQVDTTLPAGVFGDTGAGGGVAFAESSGAGGLGSVFVVHNADNTQPFFGGLDDVEVAVVDESSGAVTQDEPVRGTVDHRVNGPAALSPPDAAGGRALLFLAQSPGGTVSLVRVPVDPSGRLGTADAVIVPGADPRGGATVVYLRRGDAVEPFAAVGAGDGVRTFSLPRFPAEGPRSPQPAAAYGTPAAPVAGGGLTPGQPGSDGGSTPALYVSAAEGGGGRVHRLEQEGNVLAVRASSPPLPGAPAVAVSVAQEVVSGQPAAGWVVAGTAKGLHVLDARSLQPLGKVDGAFARSVPAAAGRIAFAAQDSGAPVVVDLGVSAPLPGEAYAAQAGHGAMRRPAAQPAISRGLVIFAGDRGLFAYRTRCGNAVAGTQAADRLQAGLPGDAIAGFAGDDALGGGDGDDCIDGGDGRDRLRGDEGDDTLSGGAGDDFVSGDAGADVVAGAAGVDRVTGGAGGDKLSGDAGNDRLDGGAGGDILLGGDGRDTMLGGDGGDRLAGGRGNDRVDGGGGDDAVNTRGGGRDRVRCGAGRDVVLADRGDRVLRDCERVLRR
jgi:Ca2+-binding RTX toxin-like protein